MQAVHQHNNDFNHLKCTKKQEVTNHLHAQTTNVLVILRYDTLEACVYTAIQRCEVFHSIAAALTSNSLHSHVIAKQLRPHSVWRVATPPFALIIYPPGT